VVNKIDDLLSVASADTVKSDTAYT